MAKAAKGTLIKRGDGAGPEVFTAIGGITSISLPGIEVPTIDATDHDSTLAKFLAGLPDGGSVNVEALYDAADDEQTGLRADALAGTLRNFKIIVPDATVEANRSTFSFSAYVTNWTPNAGGVADALKLSFVLRVSGTSTFTPAT